MRTALSWPLFWLPWPAAPVVLLVACGGGDIGSFEQAPVELVPGVAFEVRERAQWPTRAWPTATPEQVGLDPAALARVEEYAFARYGDDIDRRGQRTNALLIIKDGAIAYERYARGYDRDTPILAWSVSKSIAATVVGVAVAEGRLGLNDPAHTHYPPLDRGRHRDIRVTDLLRMSTGLAWDESYETSPFFSSVVAMLYGRGRSDMARFTASQPLAYPPGQRWRYSSGDSNLLLAVLAGTMSEQEYAGYPWRALFDRIGMTSARWERDNAGTFVASSYLHATARDLARWAFLLLADGVWQGQRILPEGWVRYMTTMAPGYSRTEITGPNMIEDNPGAHIWLNRGDPARDLPRPWPAGPPDMFAAAGHWGKLIAIFPSLDLIVVRGGDDREYACYRPESTDCVADPTRAYSTRYFVELLMEMVKP